MSTSKVDALWFGDAVVNRLARFALAPASGLYAAITGARNSLYDAGVLKSDHAPIATLGVGNLTVGGTGKTPVSAWLAAKLRELGGKPAIVMRGYGEDENLVHSALNPSIPVVTGADRLDGARRAAALGADVAVLDDAFQHRQLVRDADLLLVSADSWKTGTRWRLPAGPWRESLSAAVRASEVAITVKAASDDQLDGVSEALQKLSPDWPSAIFRLSLGELKRVSEPDSAPLASLRGQSVLAIAALANPAPFMRQLAEQGAVCTLAAYPDHHAFSETDIATLVKMAAHHQVAVCTLKDAVKLGPRWPRAAATLWYVSQRIDVSQGERSVLRLLDHVLRARRSSSTT